jgi:hypothetical protein
MGAVSNVKIGELGVSVYMGYYGGRISVGDIKFDTKKDKEKLAADRAATKKALLNFSQDKLADFILDLVTESIEV